jgi:hypothetical protein
VTSAGGSVVSRSWWLNAIFDVNFDLGHGPEQELSPQAKPLLAVFNAVMVCPMRAAMPKGLAGNHLLELSEGCAYGWFYPIILKCRRAAVIAGRFSCGQGYLRSVALIRFAAWRVVNM